MYKALKVNYILKLNMEIYLLTENSNRFNTIKCHFDVPLAVLAKHRTEIYVTINQNDNLEFIHLSVTRPTSGGILDLC